MSSPIDARLGTRQPHGFEKPRHAERGELPVSTGCVHDVGTKLERRGCTPPEAGHPDHDVSEC